MILYRLLKIEIFKTFSKWRSFISFILFAVFIPTILIVAHFSGGLGGELLPESRKHFLFSGNLYNGYFLAYFVLNLLFIHLPFLVTVAAGDLFAGEATDGTYRFLLVRSISRKQFYISKWLTNAAYTFSLLFFLGGLTLILGLILEGTGDLMAVSPEFGLAILDRHSALIKLIEAYALGALNLLTVSTLALLLSVFVSNAIGPIIASMGIIIVFYLVELIDLSVFRAIRPYLFTHYMDSWLSVFFDGKELLLPIVVHLLYIAVFTLISFVYFIRKEISS